MYTRSQEGLIQFLRFIEKVGSEELWKNYEMFSWMALKISAKFCRIPQKFWILTL